MYSELRAKAESVKKKKEVEQAKSETERELQELVARRNSFETQYLDALTYAQEARKEFRAFKQEMGDALEDVDFDPLRKEIDDLDSLAAELEVRVLLIDRHLEALKNGSSNDEPMKQAA